MNKTCGNCANYDRKIGFAPICGKCHYDQYANDFEREPSEWKPGKHFTNADHIRAMSDEELAAWIVSFGTICDICSDVTFNCDDGTIACGCCSVGVANWLKQPYKENEE